MTTEPSGVAVTSPKIRDQSLVRKFVSQYGTGYLAIGIRRPTGPIDPDPDTLRLQLFFDDPTLDLPATDDPRGVLVLDVTEGFNHPDVGKYDYDIGPANTAERGVLTALWTYKVEGIEFSFVDHLQILNQMPIWDSLDEARRFTVEQVSWMFGDLYDSTEGGPHLIDEFQTHFDFDRISLLMGRAITRMNTTGFPITDWHLPSFSSTGAAAYPPSQFDGLLTIGTYLEVVRHLRDSYTEIPNRPNMNVVYTDRTSYSQRWASILATEWPEWVRMMKMQKRKLLNLGRGSLLVAGGIYSGSAGGLFMPGVYSSAARAWRMYPSAPALAFSSTFAVGR